MNERIEQLAMQSGFRRDMFGLGVWDTPEFQKFAELIVVDVINKAERYGLGCDAVEELKEQFGVEE